MPARSWPQRPKIEKHHSFELAALTRQAKLSDLQMFFCHGLPENGAAYKVMTAAITGDMPTLAAALARPEALPDFKNAHDISPLMVACARGHKDVAEALAAHPLVNLNRQSRDGWTALHYATWMQQKETMVLLLNHLADPLVENKGGKSAYQLATEQNCAEIFLENRAFLQYMKKNNRTMTAKKEEEPVAPPAPEEKAETPTEEKPFDKYIAQIILNLGIGWKLKDAALDDLYKNLGAMPIEAFKTSFGQIEKMRKNIKNDFDWQPVFIAAAIQDNTAVMRFLHEIIPMSEGLMQKTLRKVVLAEGDAGNAVHHLLAWGADPVARQTCRLSRTLLDTAAIYRKPDCFEEMVLWNKKKNELQRHTLVFVQFGAARIDKNGRLAFDAEKQARVKKVEDIIGLMKDKEKLHGKGARKLKKIFNQAVLQRDLHTMMAAYAEAQNDRFFRGAVRMEDAAGHSAVAQALLAHKHSFALRLATDGYQLSKAEAGLLAELRHTDNETTRQLMRDLLENKADLRPIDKIIPPATKTPPIIYPLFSGRGHF